MPTVTCLLFKLLKKFKALFGNYSWNYQLVCVVAMDQVPQWIVIEYLRNIPECPMYSINCYSKALYIPGI